MDLESRRRNSIRLTGHDYTTAAAYFVTVCVEGRLPLFGEIDNGVMDLSIAGLMVESWWGNVEWRFPTVMLGSYVVMPNHFHGIVMLGAIAGSDNSGQEQGGHSGPPLQTMVQTTGRAEVYDEFVGAARCGRPIANMGAMIPPQYPQPPSLSEIVGWFKSVTTNDYGVGVRKYGFLPYNRRLWQRGYYDHIVRTESDLARIEAYIHDNPARWADDGLNPDR